MMGEFNLCDTSYVEELLKSWNLRDLIPLFQDHEITFDSLKNMNAKDVNMLIPKMGPRITFRKKLAKWQKRLQCITESGDDRQFPLCDSNEFSELPSARSEKSTRSVSSGRSTKEKLITTQLKSLTIQPSESKKIRPSLETILAYSDAGRIILKFYTEHLRLEPRIRGCLVDIIIAHCMKSKSVMTVEDYEYYADEIVKLFPNESKETYFDPQKPF